MRVPMPFSLLKSMFNNFYNTVFLIKTDNPKCWQKYDSGASLRYCSYEDIDTEDI